MKRRMTKRGGAAGGARAGALSTYLRWRLKALDLTPTQLGELSGVGRSTVYRLLKPTPPPVVTTDVLHKLAVALEVDPRVLAELWHGIAQEVEYQDDRDTLVRGFILATSELSYDDLEAVLEVARAAAAMRRRPGRG